MGEHSRGVMIRCSRKLISKKGRRSLEHIRRDAVTSNRAGRWLAGVGGRSRAINMVLRQLPSLVEVDTEKVSSRENQDEISGGTAGGIQRLLADGSVCKRQQEMGRLAARRYGRVFIMFGVWWQQQKPAGTRSTWRVEISAS